MREEYNEMCGKIQDSPVLYFDNFPEKSILPSSGGSRISKMERQPPEEGTNLLFGNILLS